MRSVPAWWTRCRAGRSRRCSAAALASVLVLAASSASTASVRAAELAGPNVTVGPALELARSTGRRDKVQVVHDEQRRAHVVFAADGQGEVLEFVIDAGGHVERRIVATGRSPETIDAAYDATGRLHVLVDAGHFEFADGTWSASAHTPWAQAGIRPESAKFVEGGPYLLWMVMVGADTLGTPPRTDRRAGPMLPFPMPGGTVMPMPTPSIPVPTKGSKTVLVAEFADGTFGPWLAIEPQAQADTGVWGGAADAAGNVHLVYALVRRSGEPQLAYALVPMAALSQGRTQEQDPVSGTRIWAMQDGGRSFLALQGRSWKGSGALAVDPAGRCAVAGFTDLFRDGGWSTLPTPEPKFRSGIGLGAAGQESFHSLVIGQRTSDGYPLEYRLFSGGAWSGPVTVGTVKPSALDVFSAETAMRGTADGRAFVVWKAGDRLTGRWIELAR